MLGGRRDAQPSLMEQIETIYENSWKGGTSANIPGNVPGPEILIDAVEDLCRSAQLDRVVLLVDEAAHVFIPEQQRQFFTLMRDLRSPHLSVKAAVYPGATAFGEVFQPGHDATVISVDRNVTDHTYATAMREIVIK
jgi:hypothetical protein